MDSPGTSETVGQPPLCSRCGTVLGVYEPLVCVVDGRVRRTSRAADPGLLQSAEACYHAACFERRMTSAIDAA